MAYINCNLKSEALMTSVNVKLYFPCDLPGAAEQELSGVLTLLHGYTNSGDDWQLMSPACRYAADNGLALIMPDCGNSFYQDMVYGGAYKTFVTEEMPMLLRKIFQLPAQREKNFIAGLSMGGYGALYLGMSRPDLYAGCASFSGAVEPELMVQRAEGNPPMKALLNQLYGSIFGPGQPFPPTSDLELLADQIAQLPKEQQPRILLTNGNQDLEPYWIAPQNDLLDEHLKTLELAHYRRIRWDGVHEWNFWDRSLVYAVDYFLQNGYAAKKIWDWASPAQMEGEVE